MNIGLATAIVGASVSLISFLGNYIGAKSATVSHSAVVDEKLDNLTKKVEKHNCLVERTYKIEQVLEVQNEQIKVQNHRINNLERKVN